MVRTNKLRKSPDMRDVLDWLSQREFKFLFSAAVYKNETSVGLCTHSCVCFLDCQLFKWQLLSSENWKTTFSPAVEICARAAVSSGSSLNVPFFRDLPWQKDFSLQKIKFSVISSCYYTSPRGRQSAVMALWDKFGDFFGADDQLTPSLFLSPLGPKES